MNKKFMTMSKAMLVAGLMTLLAFPARAEIVSTEQVVTQTDRDRVRAFLEREGTEKQLQTFGVSSETAKERVNAMTDEEIRIVAGKIDRLPAGAALSQTDWIIVLLLFILLLIVI
jgi:hypothetical protein